MSDLPPNDRYNGARRRSALPRTVETYFRKEAQRLIGTTDERTTSEQLSGEGRHHLMEREAADLTLRGKERRSRQRAARYSFAVRRQLLRRSPMAKDPIRRFYFKSRARRYLEPLRSKERAAHRHRCPECGSAVERPASIEAFRVPTQCDVCRGWSVAVNPLGASAKGWFAAAIILYLTVSLASVQGALAEGTLKGALLMIGFFMILAATRYRDMGRARRYVSASDRSWWVQLWPGRPPTIGPGV